MDLKELNLQFGKAEMSGDKEFFKKYLSDNMLFRRASGDIHSKEDFLNSLADEHRKYHCIETDIKRVSIAPNGLNAVVKAIVFVKMSIDGKDLQGHYANMRFFQKFNNQWTLTAWYNEESDKNNRQYKTSELPTLVEDFPKLDKQKSETLWSLYQHICSSWETLVDIRFKLLALVPGAALLLIFQLSQINISAMKIAGALAGIIITSAIWLYEMRNSELHDDLISRARKIESELGIETGQFLGRKLNSSILVKHDVALKMIYSVSVISLFLFLFNQFIS